jgi:hypothetical protein
MSESRKYSISEINRMRNAIAGCYPSGESYRASERSAEVEDRLRTHMQNGTDPEELEAAANARMDADIAWQQKEQEILRQYEESLPKPRVIQTADDLLEAWFEECVAKYHGACETSDNLYDGFMGMTLCKFANQRAPDGVHVTQKQMEKFLDAKGVRSRSAMFKKRYDGIRHVMYGNYGT